MLPPSAMARRRTRRPARPARGGRRRRAGRPGRRFVWTDAATTRRPPTAAGRRSAGRSTAVAAPRCVGGRRRAELGAPTGRGLRVWRGRRRCRTPAQRGTPRRGRRRRAGRRVARVHASRAGRIRPSCTTDTARSPSWREEQAAGDAPAVRRRRGVLVVEQPLVGAERPVEPHGMVEAGHLDPLAHERAAVGQERGVEQGHVRRGRRARTRAGPDRRAARRWPAPRRGACGGSGSARSGGLQSA